MGEGAGQCRIPAGVVTNPSTGHVYVADASNGRIDEFSAWGTFIKAWGWGVRDGKSELQTCTAQTGCQAGLEGTGVGQLSDSRGIAIDSTGDIYVAESNLTNSNFRVQKFDSEGNFVLMFGGDVDQGPSHPGNLCTTAYVVAGDTCGAGGLGPANGQFDNPFGFWPFASFIAIGPGDKVYVGDEERIQRFDTGGHYVESLPLPGETVNGLAVDPGTGDLYVSFCNLDNVCMQNLTVPGSKPDVHKLSPVGVEIAKLAVPDPQALATDSAGNLYVADGVKRGEATKLQIHKFTSAGVEVPSFTFDDGFDASTGIATSSACGIGGTDLYVSNTDFNASYIRTYGPPPDPELCPPPKVPPTIADQYATSVDSKGATLKGKVSPNFWPDTRYYVEYGTGKCSEGECDAEQPLAPGSKLASLTTNSVVTTAGVFLGDLEPNTAYHYRFVAQSSGGGPVRGVGGEVGSDGAEGTFTTFPLPPAPRTDCPNQQFRTAASAPLPDCRAYEMVSPVDKNGGDVAIGAVGRAFAAPVEAALGGERFTYSSLRPFAAPGSAPLVSQYLSSRGPDGWSSDSISPPRVNPPLWPPGFNGQFKAFDEDLCSAWVLQDSDLALAHDAPPQVANLYRRDNCASEPSYELHTSVAPPGFGFGPGQINPELYIPSPQGHSADGSHTVFRTPAGLTSNSCGTAGIFQVYETSKEGTLRLISVLPPNKGNKATCTNSSVGIFQGLTDAFRESSLSHAVSEDGSRVFWTDSREPSIAGNGPVGSGPGKLYVRLNAPEAPSKVSVGKCIEPERACTLAISESPNTFYWGADREGTKAIYSIKEESETQLFAFDVDAAKTQLIAGGVIGIGGTSGVAGISADASRIYFVSTKVLSGTQQNSYGDEAQAAQPNLYLSDEGRSRSSARSPDWTPTEPRSRRSQPCPSGSPPG